MIAAAIRTMYRGKRQPPLPVRVRDEPGGLFADAESAEAFGSEGRPGWSPGRLALITVLQRVENLTDRQAAETVRADLSWKYALGLALDDPGFDASVLSEFRTRVVAHGLEEKALDLLLAKLAGKGLIEAGGKRGCRPRRHSVPSWRALTVPTVMRWWKRSMRRSPRRGHGICPRCRRCGSC
ncbi:transposase [Nonomuraea diastatica]|uniref:transposase n=1 Tax=Nonomuraea diastatica TaxID=1848329 RepID=UPI0014099617